jgi:hypothetical protein
MLQFQSNINPHFEQPSVALFCRDGKPMAVPIRSDRAKVWQEQQFNPQLITATLSAFLFRQLYSLHNLDFRPLSNPLG